MRAVRLTEIGAPLEAVEIETPDIGARDILIRVKAAGICHSDAHYRAGVSHLKTLPLTPGHEIAGVIERTGAEAPGFAAGDRVCVHYLATCGECVYCRNGTEQFCRTGAMIGKDRDGGYAEFVAVPVRSVVHLPAGIPFEQGAILMCSSATSLHALHKTRLRPGESVAIYGVGGLGISAVQLARTLGATEVFAVDVNPRKLELAARFGALPIDAATADPVAEIRRQTDGRGVDVALELIGLARTMRQAVQSLAPLGRAGLVGLTRETLELAPYTEILNREAEIIGVSDHLAAELPSLLEAARTGALDLARGIIRTIPLEPSAINETLDRLAAYGDDVRVVITP